ncbi:hypothetical protein JAAARDRAFT_34675 [Jaapia argillacea MUCL 33604]|uniref:Methyltransferase type 11 domain-containing protein n=1 Tax=Jaapia argillacea MUCL 33604 TaxID=933084 RepID=A0A067Q2Y7_9AGAM|nr:hypothetical protein JAAARDRAFT_34675 [Jaapia argillacea MUCL 33604]
MKFRSKISLLQDLYLCLKHAFVPTFLAIVSSPLLLLSPASLSRTFMAHVWAAFANGVDQNGKDVKEGLIPENAHGVVLDLGAGHGHTLNYLKREKVTKYVALEPNVLMHAHIRALAETKGYTESDGSLQILSCGAEDTHTILLSLSPSPPTEPLAPQADTIISILTLCSVPSPVHTLSSLYTSVLKSGGTFLFYEHVLNPNGVEVAWWQRFWTPVWKRAFDGCRLDRPTDVWVKGGMGVGGEVWREGECWGKEGEDKESLFWHAVGRFVKV